MRERSRRRRIGTAVAVAIGLSVVTLSSAPAGAATAPGPQSPASVVKKAHPTAMLSLATTRATQAWQRTHTAASTAAATVGAKTLAYNGGTNGVGVMSGAKTKVYLVFYGNQWGTQGADANGNATFSGDPHGAAPVAQQMFRGIGTNGETWSADLTQWCDGAGVTAGAYSCPSSLPASQFVPYQSGGVLAGVWYDNAAASPSAATEGQLTQEAINAAGHFGNTTADSNRNAYYVVLSPHGTNPDNYQSPTQGYCAWHSWNGDTTLNGGPYASPYGNIAFSNQPYNMDMGATCGTNFVNSGTAGELDGYTMTLGHEWHEMMSDTLTTTGWANPGTNGGKHNDENSDECAWISPGSTGGAANINFGSYGSYAEQASWSNDTNNCAISHAILTHGTTNTVTVTNPGNQNSAVGASVSLQVRASDSASGQTLSYSAAGLPSGLSINASTGLISGTATTAGTSSVTVTAKDGTNASGSTTFSWTVSTGSTGGLTNGGFDSGSLSGWTSAGVTAATSGAAHSGSYGAMVGSTSPTGTSSLAQTFTAPAASTKLSFAYNVTCPDTVTYDWATATLKDNTTGTTATVLAKTCVASSGWVTKTATVTAGHSYTLTLVNTDDNYPGDPTYTYYDDVTVS